MLYRVLAPLLRAAASSCGQSRENSSHTLRPARAYTGASKIVSAGRRSRWPAGPPAEHVSTGSRNCRFPHRALTDCADEMSARATGTSRRASHGRKAGILTSDFRLCWMYLEGKDVVHIGASASTRARPRRPIFGASGRIGLPKPVRSTTSLPRKGAQGHHGHLRRHKIEFNERRRERPGALPAISFARPNGIKVRAQFDGGRGRRPRSEITAEKLAARQIKAREPPRDLRRGRS